MKQQKVSYEDHLTFGSYNQEICKIDNGKPVKIN